ncbi:MAG TPA: ribosome-binding factor A [Geobacteraceae bacterium]|nr:ribosome-binding factor A [Geobacteraceae bacterium]
MTVKRAEKVAEAIHEIISALLIKGVKDPRIGFTTITGVKLSDDLHLATVFFSVVGDETEKKAAEKGLNSAKGYLRKEVGRNLRMRYVPDLVFRYDASLDYGQHIDELLDEIISTEHNDDIQDN